MLNRSILADKALSMWEETLPLILRRFRHNNSSG